MINGRYQLHNKLGQGGMGIVHRATDRLTGEIVALKQVFLPVEQILFASRPISQTNRELRLALAHEFQVLAGLRHPNIISVLDYGFDENGQPFFTMSYLENAQAIVAAANGRSLPQKITLLLQTLEALAYLHRRGILHRDLKPDNVLVVGDTVRVLDFGLAAAKEQASDSVGSWLYMAPEVLQGQPASEASDLYAVGVLAYQLLAGTHPFDLYAEDTVGEILEGEPDWTKIQGGEELTAVVRTLLAKKPAKRFSSANQVIAAFYSALGQAVPEETAVIRESYLQAAKFVGREAEMAQLTKALQKAADKQGAAWLIGGESGVGKTRLINEMRTHALVNGFQVLHGQTMEDGGLPYQAWRAPVRHLVATLPEVDDLTASVLLPLVPDMAQLLERDVPPATELKEDAAQVRLFTTIARLFWRAKRPLLLILEDLHLAHASLLPLPYLTRLVANYPLLILGSYRSDERPHLPEEISDVIHLPLPRLSAAAMADLSAAMLGNVGRDKRIQRLLQRETEGNAFFAVEVVRTLADEAGRLGDIGQMTLPETLLPNGIQDIVQRRVGKLPDEARELLVKTAVVGRELEIPLIQQLSGGLDVENEWLPLCADTAVLDVQNGVWQFSHGKIRDGLLDKLTPAEKARLHGEVAIAIETIHPDDAQMAVPLAHHWQAAKNVEKERHYAEMAGQQAAAQYAHQDALRYYNQTLELTAPTELEKQYTLQLACFNAYRFMANVAKQQETLHDLTKLGQALGDTEKQVHILNRKGEFYYRIGDLDTSKATYVEAAELARANDLAALEFDALTGWAIVVGTRRDLAEGFETLERAKSLLPQINDPIAQIHLTNILAALTSFAGESWQSVKYHQENLRVGRAQGATSATQTTLGNLAARYTSLGEYEQAETYFRESLIVAQQLGHVYAETLAQNNMGVLYSRLGVYPQAIITLKDCLVLCRQTGNWLTYSNALNNIGVAYHKKGDLVQAKAYLQQAIAQKQTLNDRWSEAYTWNMLGHLLLDSNDDANALAAYQTAESLQVNLSQTPTLVESWAGLAAAFARLGYLDKAQTYAAKAWHHLQTKAFEGEWEWAVSALHLHETLGQLEDVRATAVIQLAHAELQKRAANIATETSREKFLTQVPENRELVRLYARLTEKPVVPHTQSEKEQDD